MTQRTSQATFFATTRWTMVREAVRGGDDAARSALGGLFSIYWQPLYRYARRKGKSREDAEDLVQGFLAHLMTSRALQGIDQAKGRFRSFLLISFQHWMINDWKHATREKRGGGSAVVSFDWESAETGLKLEIADERSPDRLFDREWALALLRKALEELEKVCRAEGSGGQFDVLKPCLTADSGRIAYSDLAEVLDMTEGATRVAVHRLRKRYRRILTEQISRTLASPDSVEEEMQSLFSALGG
jgi:RNA polymerase sigma factor (sigma-70 family)